MLLSLVLHWSRDVSLPLQSTDAIPIGRFDASTCIGTFCTDPHGKGTSLTLHDVRDEGGGAIL